MEVMGFCPCMCVTSGVSWWVQYVCIGVLLRVCVFLSEYSVFMPVPCQIRVVCRGGFYRELVAC